MIDCGGVPQGPRTPETDERTASQPIRPALRRKKKRISSPRRVVPVPAWRAGTFIGRAAREGGSLSLRYRWAQQARCAIRRPPSPCLRSRIPRTLCTSEPVTPPPCASRARPCGGWGALFPGGGKFPPHPPASLQRSRTHWLLSAMMIADPIDAINEDEVGAPPCGAEAAWAVVSVPGRAILGHTRPAELLNLLPLLGWRARSCRPSGEPG